MLDDRIDPAPKPLTKKTWFTPELAIADLLEKTEEGFVTPSSDADLAFS